MCRKLQPTARESSWERGQWHRLVKSCSSLPVLHIVIFELGTGGDSVILPRKVLTIPITWRPWCVLFAGLCSACCQEPMIGDFKTVIHMLRRNGFQEAVGS